MSRQPAQLAWYDMIMNLPGYQKRRLAKLTKHTQFQSQFQGI